MRRLGWFVLVLAFCSTAAWPKWKQDEQKYLDDQLRAIRHQVQQLASQMPTLNAQLTEPRQNQSQFQAVIIRHQRSLRDLDQIVSSMRLRSEDNFSNLKHAVTQLRTDTMNALKQLGGQGAPTPGGTREQPSASKPATLPVPPPVQGYVTVVPGTDVMVDLGSDKGMHQGSRLALFKANDPSARVGVVEVKQVVDTQNSKARVVTISSGVRLEFGNIVRVA